MDLKTRYVRRDQSHYAVQSLDRAIDLIEAFSSGAEELGVAELAQMLDLPRATVHRLLASLAHRGLLAHNERSGKYRLGLRLFELGSLVGSALDVKRVAHPGLVSLVRESGETAHLVILDGVEIVFVDKVETDNPFRMVSQIGVRLPARHSGSGKALLAQLDDAELARRFAEAAAAAGGESNADLPALCAQLETVRAQGWAIDDQETQAGLRCVGAVIRDHTGAAVAGMSISGPIVRMTDERIPELATLLRTKAQGVSRALGYRPSG